MKKFGTWVTAILLPTGLTAGEVSIAPGVSFSGSPTYISEFSSRFRDNGGPLSSYGSHFGLKAEVGSREFAGVRHFACTTGRTILDYSRTGLVGISSLRFFQNGVLLREAEERQIQFDYFGWQENARFSEFSATAQVFFLGPDQYLISARLQNTGAMALSLQPILFFQRRGEEFSPVSSPAAGIAVFRFSVQPIFTRSKNYLAVGPWSLAEVRRGDKAAEVELWGETLSLAPGESWWLWYFFGYSPDRAAAAVQLVEQAQERFSGPEAAWRESLAWRDRFLASLPPPHLAPEQSDYLNLYHLAAAALHNALYAPRGRMRYWACVPTKVHYNWFWLWDSGFQALGYSEFAPETAREVILSVFQAQQPDGFIAHMADERAEPLTPHSQPPVFGYSAGKMIARGAEDPALLDFVRTMYEPSERFLAWWEKARDVNHNGLFEYISQDEGGWDNSPRADYVPKLMFISYWGYLGEILGAKFKPLDNADLNAWMFFYYRAMADWAEALGRTEDASHWRARAMTLAAKVDEILWDEERGCWFDTWSRRGGKRFHHFPVLTPAIWFPAFAGATLDERKARTCIERHLLNPEEFFGTYPIPTVAYNDPRFDNTTPGWTASIWLVTAYSAVETLFRFGYEAEAEELRARLLRMMAGQKDRKGIYETYDPFTGQYRNESSTGGYASFQFGWSSAFTLELILERFQEERFVFADTKQIQGFIRRAEDFYTREVFYRVQAGREVPRLELESADGKPLLESGRVRLKLSDPFQALPQNSFQVWIKGKPFKVELEQETLLRLD